MSLSSTRVLIVDADPESGGALAAHLAETEGIDIVSVVHNRNAAKAEAETLKPDVLLVDLLLPGYRSIDIVRHVAETQPEIHIRRKRLRTPYFAEPTVAGYRRQTWSPSLYRLAKTAEGPLPAYPSQEGPFGRMRTSAVGTGS